MKVLRGPSWGAGKKGGAVSKAPRVFPTIQDGKLPFAPIALDNLIILLYNKDYNTTKLP